jgi:hypothetical protein
MKDALTLLKNDIKKLLPAIAAIAVYFIATALIFGEFCPFKIIFGIPCPACGLTHAGLALLSLNFSAALQYNPAIFLWVPLILIMLFRRYIQKKSQKALYPLIIFVALATIVIYLASP